MMLLLQVFKVTIIQEGTGTLRKAIHRHFRGHTHVESYRLGVYGEGEDGVTVVTEVASALLL